MNTMPEARTKEQFDKLPLLLTRAEFLHWTGLSADDLDAGCADGSIPFRLSRPGGYRKYFKWHVATMCGMERER